jgi:hypothetical protein
VNCIYGKYGGKYQFHANGVGVRQRDKAKVYRSQVGKNCFARGWLVIYVSRREIKTKRRRYYRKALVRVAEQNRIRGVSPVHYYQPEASEQRRNNA